MTTDSGDHDHPYALKLRSAPCPCPISMTLDPDALDDSGRQSSHATALLLAGESFLTAARDPRKPLELRVQLEKAGLRLLSESVRHVFESQKSD